MNKMTRFARKLERNYNATRDGLIQNYNELIATTKHYFHTVQNARYETGDLLDIDKSGEKVVIVSIDYNFGNVFDKKLQMQSLINAIPDELKADAKQLKRDLVCSSSHQNIALSELLIDQFIQLKERIRSTNIQVRKVQSQQLFSTTISDNHDPNVSDYLQQLKRIENCFEFYEYRQPDIGRLSKLFLKL